MGVITNEEKLLIMDRYSKLMLEGKTEEAMRIAIKIPLAPHLAMAAKEVYGIDYIRNAGFDLSEAEAKYGNSWLTK